MINAISILKPFAPRPSTIGGWTLSVLATKLATAKMVTKFTTMVFTLMSFVVIVPIRQVSKTGHQALPSTHIATRQHPKASRAVRPAPVKQVKSSPVVVTRISNAPADPQLRLHSFAKQYTFLFSGKVTCGDGLCQGAQVQIHVNSLQNENIVKSASVQEDGTYEASLILREKLNQHVDWWIVADSPESAAKQVQGRQILTDDSSISIEEPLQLL